MPQALQQRHLHAEWYEQRLALSGQIEAATSDSDVERIGVEIDELDRLIISTPGNGYATLAIQLEIAKKLAEPGGSCILDTLDVILSHIRSK